MDGPWDVRSLLLYVTTPPALPMIALEQPAHPLGIVARQSGVHRSIRSGFRGTSRNRTRLGYSWICPSFRCMISKKSHIIHGCLKQKFTWPSWLMKPIGWWKPEPLDEPKSIRATPMDPGIFNILVFLKINIQGRPLLVMSRVITPSIEGPSLKPLQMDGWKTSFLMGRPMRQC